MPNPKPEEGVKSENEKHGSDAESHGTQFMGAIRQRMREGRHIAALLASWQVPVTQEKIDT